MDADEIRRAKRELRRLVRARVATMTPEQRASAATAACGIASEEPHFRGAASVLLYLSLPDEIDAHPLLEAALADGKRVFLPRVDWDQDTMEAVEVFSPTFPTEVRRHALLEPLGTSVSEPATLDVIVVPGVAFDRSGGRVGRGRGFYDRFLAQAGREGAAGRTGARAFRLGLCFSQQIVESVAREAHDEPVDAIASDSGLTVC